MAKFENGQRITRILIVEDDAAQRATLSDILEQDGFSTTTAANAAEALECVRRESFGVAILDFRLPDITGTQLLEQILALNDSARVIIHTAYGSFDSAKDAVNQGAFAYVEKGRDPGELLRHVHRAVQFQFRQYTGDLEFAVAQGMASLSESEERYRSVIELSPDGIAIHDAARFVYINSLGARLIGARGTNEALGKSLTDFVSADASDRVGHLLESVLTEHNPVDFGELRFTTTEGRGVYLEIRGVFVPFGGSPGVQLLLRDITDRKRAEDERRVFEAHLRETQKMETAGQLAAGIAHDFNNLLTVILGNSELLQDKLIRGPLPIEAAKPLVHQIELAGNRAASLTQRLLTFSRRQPANYQPHDINHILLGLDDLVRRLIGECNTFVLTPGDCLPRIQADASQIEQIILNLVVNARDAMPNGGTFLIETSRVQPGESFFATHPELTRGVYVCLTASDTGTGIPIQTLDRIFEPFFTTKPSGKGTGLGLATVYGIVRQAGGCIDVTSEVGVGTTFTIHWPAFEQLVDSQEAAAPAQMELPVSGTILVCEDDEMVLTVTREMLHSSGFTVLTGSSAIEAIRIATAYRGEIDLLLTDVLLPDMKGNIVADRLCSLIPNLKVLLMSGCATDDAQHAGNVEFGHPILTKPFTKDELIRAVTRAMGAARSARSNA